MSDILADIKVTSAHYDPQGYVLVQWVADGLERAPTSFVLSVRGVGPGETTIESFVAEDGMSRTCSFACELSDSLRYTIAVTPFSGDEMLGGSPWFPLTFGPPPQLSHFAFVERLAFTPLLLDMAFNVVKVCVLRMPDGAPVAGVPIQWAVPPAYPSVRLESKQATYTDAQGIAVKRILVADARDLPSLLTVSAWHDEAGARAAAHTSVLFACVRPRVFSSFVRNYAHPLYDDPNSPTSELTDDELITSTTTILDDKNRPIRGLRFAWRMEPNAATCAFGRASSDGSREPLRWTDKPKYELGYAGYTNEEGQATISFANTAPTIMTFSPAVNSIEYQNDVVFTHVDSGGTAPPLSLPLNRNTLELNTYPESVPVTVPFGSVPAGRVAVWLNQDIATIVYRSHVSQVSGPETIWIPSWRFSSDNTNQAGYIQGDMYGNAEDSRLIKFQVIGQAQLPRPVEVPKDAPAAPELVRPGVTVIDNGTISNGLLVRIPAYPTIKVGQRVSLNLFISAFYQGTNSPKFDYPTLRHDVEIDDFGGFVLVVDEELLTGYSSSRNGAPGTFIAQYSIETPASVGPSSPIYSRPFSVPISTTVPHKASDWVALDFGDA